MKYLLKKDLNLLLTEEIIDQLTCDNDELLNQAEAKALATVDEWIGDRYDLSFELRPYVDYINSEVYFDTDRIRVAQNDSNDAFEAQYGLQLLSSGLMSGITNEFILAKTVNSCELPYIKYCDSKLSNDLVNYYELNSQFSPQLNNPDMTFTGTNEHYSSTCGDFTYSATTDGSTITQEDYDTLLSGGTYTGVTLTTKTYNFGGKINYYNTVYLSASTEALDYNQQSLVNGLEPQVFIGNIDFFDQYLLVNQERDFVEDDRNASLVDITASLTIYELVRRASPRLMSEVIADGYDMSMQKLKDIRRGNVSIRLRENECAPEKGLGYGFRFGQNTGSIRNNY